MSLSHSNLSKPKIGEKIPAGTLTYFRVRNRQRLWELLVEEFEKSGISQAELCRRIGRDPAKISGYLGSPSNIEIDTASDLFFGMSGAEPIYAVSHPLEKSARNYRQPEWIKKINTTTDKIELPVASQKTENNFSVQAFAA